MVFQDSLQHSKIIGERVGDRNEDIGNRGLAHAGWNGWDYWDLGMGLMGNNTI